MTRHFVFKSSATWEYAEAIAWYEKQRPGLGREFAAEVIQTLQRARIQPELFRKVRGQARKIRLKRFKAYNIYFVVKSNTLSVLPVFHSSRNPEELRPRLQ